MYEFVIDKDYTKKDIYKIIGISEATKGGTWDTGYNFYKDDLFIFTNIGVPGRTGHLYNNKFNGEYLYWFAKNNTKIKQPSIQKMLNPPKDVYVFYRTDNIKAFTFAGTAKPYSYQDISPVQITWKIFNSFDEVPYNLLENEVLSEGKKRKITASSYERNPEARKRCVEYYGYKCAVCDFDFVKTYGSIGELFIHVHHLDPLGGSSEERYVDPIKDLRPVCPNCHAMIHRKIPVFTIEELQKMLMIKR